MCHGRDRSPHELGFKLSKIDQKRAPERGPFLLALGGRGECGQGRRCGGGGTVAESGDGANVAALIWPAGGRTYRCFVYFQLSVIVTVHHV